MQLAEKTGVSDSLEKELEGVTAGSEKIVQKLSRQTGCSQQLTQQLADQTMHVRQLEQQVAEKIKVSNSLIQELALVTASAEKLSQQLAQQTERTQLLTQQLADQIVNVKCADEEVSRLAQELTATKQTWPSHQTVSLFFPSFCFSVTQRAWVQKYAHCAKQVYIKVPGLFCDPRLPTISVLDFLWRRVD